MLALEQEDTMNDDQYIEQLGEFGFGRFKTAFEGIPPRMIGGIARWLLHGIDGGSFLMAVFNNDLVGAYGRADEENTAAMRAYANMLYNDFPSNAWRPENIKEWRESGGFIGQRKKRAAAE